MQEGFVNLLIGAKLEEMTAIGSLVDHEFDLRQKRESLDTGGFEIGARGQRHAEAFQFLVGDGSEFNLGIERFVQGGENFQLAQCQRMTNGREQRHDADQHPS